MKPDTISLRRRQLMVASLAATPMAALASQPGALAGAADLQGRLVVSGRILDADGKPVFGARIEVLRAGADTTVTTDADGRFMLATTASSRIRYRVSHEAHGARSGRLDLAPDDAGTWRGSFGLALA